MDILTLLAASFATKVACVGGLILALLLTTPRD